MKKIIQILFFIPLTFFAQDLHEEERLYEYDNLNRLSRVVFSNGTIYDYVYDNLGNRIQRNLSELELTYVPDDAFEQKLIDLGYDNTMNDYVVTANISGVTFLFASDLGIQDATGIEDFESIQTLYFNNNNISEIDISQNTQLEFFQIAGNNLSNIDLSNNTLLESLDISNNILASVDIANNQNLFFLSCDNNQISNLDLSNNIALGLLNAHYNNLIELDLSQNINLSYIWIKGNPIEDLDFSNNSNLNEVNARDCNNLTSLNMKNGNNTILTQFLSDNCPNLFCIQVDDENAANNGTGVYASWVVDAQVQYSEDCEFLGVDDNDLKGISLYPNPTENNLFLSLPKYVGLNLKYSLFDLNGKLVKQNFVIVDNINLDIDVSSLSSGTYIIQVLINNRAWSSNFIKN